MNMVKNNAELEHRIGEFLKRKNKDPENLNSKIKLEFQSCDFEKREMTLRHIVAPEEISPIHTMHGGFITYLLDSAMGSLLSTYTGSATPTVNINVNYLRPLLEGDDVMIRAKLTHIGSSIGNSYGEILVKGEVRVVATANFFILKSK